MKMFPSEGSLEPTMTLDRLDSFRSQARCEACRALLSAYAAVYRADDDTVVTLPLVDAAVINGDSVVRLVHDDLHGRQMLR